LVSLFREWASSVARKAQGSKYPGIDAPHHLRLAWLEQAPGPVLAVATEYESDYRVNEHTHTRGQLLHAQRGIVLVTTVKGRWMVPPGHALWIPPGVTHAVDMIGSVSMQSVYVSPDAVEGLPQELRVFALTQLMRSLIMEAVSLPQDEQPLGRSKLVLDLLLVEIPNLEQRPLALPFPSEPRLARLCRKFIEKPDPHATIDSWAEALAMSRRSFTRNFARQTGLSFSTWRQQACLFSALPRLTSGEPVISVALDLGYDSVPAFTTMFKRMLGQPPRAYLGMARNSLN